jgi:hypothetical protein
MTSVENRPRQVPREPAADTPTSPTLAGLYVALRAAGLSLLVVAVPVLVAWATATGSGAGAPEAVRSALQVWLLAHHATLSTPDGPIGLVPLGLTALAGLMLAVSAGRGARAAHVRDPRSAATLVTVASLSYAVLVAILCTPATGAGVRPGPVSGFLGALLLAGVTTGVTVTRAAGTWDGFVTRLDQWWRAVLAAAATATAALVAGGALVVLLATGTHLGRTADLTDRLGAGWVGTAVLLLLCLALVPNAVVAGVAYAGGTGFAVGTGTVVAPHAVHLGAVPALPLLGGLPDHSVPALGWAALAVPVAAGVLAGRRVLPVHGAAIMAWREVLGRAAAAGGLAGSAVGVLTLLASGPAGAGRLQHVGATWWQVGPAVAAEVAALAMAAAAAGKWRARQQVS